MNTSKIGFVGLGKLGYPLAVAVAQTYPVVGYDVNPELSRKQDPYPHRERGPTGKDDFNAWQKAAQLTFAPLPEMVAQADVIFVCVQTPHGPQYEGITELPSTRSDFDYSYLLQAAQSIAPHLRPTRDQVVCIVSTVLPGTTRRVVLPELAERCAVLYNPCFAAMGTVAQDFLQPEFVLLGYDTRDCVALGRLVHLYEGLHGGYDGVRSMSIESAELCKVAYNASISAKIVLANTLMEICHKVPGCDVDEITNTLALATKRIVSPAYTKGGGLDGGACHPRDGIAMSWLAQQLDLSYDFFGEMTKAREAQAMWLANLAANEAAKHKLPLVLLGKAYKPETNLTVGSGALLVANILKGWNVPFRHIDPVVDKNFCAGGPAVFLVLTKHAAFRGQTFALGSVVIDPFRYVKSHEGTEVIRVGVGK